MERLFVLCPLQRVYRRFHCIIDAERYLFRCSIVLEFPSAFTDQSSTSIWSSWDIPPFFLFLFLHFALWGRGNTWTLYRCRSLSRLGLPSGYTGMGTLMCFSLVTRASLLISSGYWRSVRLLELLSRDTSECLVSSAMALRVSSIFSWLMIEISSLGLVFPQDLLFALPCGCAWVDIFSCKVEVQFPMRMLSSWRASTTCASARWGLRRWVSPL